MRIKIVQRSDAREKLDSRKMQPQKSNWEKIFAGKIRDPLL